MKRWQSFNLPRIILGVMGATGKHHVANDTWLLTAEIARDAYLQDESLLAGHHMVITGYDDEAIAIDGHGKNIEAC